MVFLCYNKCTTCQKARKWLDEQGIAYEERWQQMSGLPLKKFFNTSGLLYKSLGLKDKLASMSEQEQYDLLATDGMLVKRPMLIGDDFVLVGFRQPEWEAKLK